MVTALTLLTQLIIYSGKHNLNNLNFLLSGKDIKHKPKKLITRLRPMRLLYCRKVCDCNIILKRIKDIVKGGQNVNL